MTPPQGLNLQGNQGVVCNVSMGLFGEVATRGSEASAIFTRGCYWPVAACHERQKSAKSSHSTLYKIRGDSLSRSNPSPKRLMFFAHDRQQSTQSSRNPAFESWLERIDPARPKSCLVFLAYVVERLCASHFRLDSAYACPAIPAGIA